MAEPALFRCVSPFMLRLPDGGRVPVPIGVVVDEHDVRYVGREALFESVTDAAARPIETATARPGAARSAAPAAGKKRGRPRKEPATTDPADDTPAPAGDADGPSSSE